MKHSVNKLSSATVVPHIRVQHTWSSCHTQCMPHLDQDPSECLQSGARPSESPFSIASCTQPTSPTPATSFECETVPQSLKGKQHSGHRAGWKPIQGKRFHHGRSLTHQPGDRGVAWHSVYLGLCNDKERELKTGTLLSLFL